MTRTAGLLLIAGFIAVLVGALLYITRGGTRGAAASPSVAYLSVERGLIAAAALITAAGLVVYATTAVDGAPVLARSGAAGYAAAAVILTIVEVRGVSSARLPDASVLIYVVVAFLAQAVVGAALLQAAELSPWIGGATIVWNIAWLVALPIVSPSDLYFPVLHHVMPLVIGIALFRPAVDPAAG